MQEDEALHALLSSFCCDKDADIEMFLRTRAVEFEKIAKSRTYLVLDADQLAQPTEDRFQIYGYVTLAVKTLYIPARYSNRMRKEIDGFSAKRRGDPISDAPCYLIGQLSKNTAIPGNPLTGAALLQFAGGVLAAAVQAVGGRYVMIECRPHEKLLAFYGAHGFTEFDRADGMVQMIRKIGAAE